LNGGSFRKRGLLSVMLFLSFYAPIHHFSQTLLDSAHEDGHIVKKAAICKKEYIGMKLGRDYQAMFFHVQNVSHL
jgi:hypothetical protein